MKPRGHAIKIYLSSADREAIEARAKAAGLSLSTFLRDAGLGVRIEGQEHARRLLEVIQLAERLPDKWARLQLSAAIKSLAP
jgi:hypothetical protein